MKIRRAVAAALVIWSSAAARAGGAETATDSHSTNLDYAQVLFVEAAQGSDGSWCISTTVRHHDEGWDHYANAWQVLDEEGNEIGWRLLAHPHVDEQPFTREQCDIDIPADAEKIVVRAKCKVHGFGVRTVEVDLSVDEGETFRVIRKAQ